MKGLRVAVVGAGLGGLCLAQGLHRAGADVAVYERDTALASRRQGYRLVALADIDETFLVRIRASVPVPGWPPSRVTLLGDAIHAMSPARGSGANTALQDAGLLYRTLTESAPEGRALVQAIGRYETQMREYGYAAVAASRQAEAETGAWRHSVVSWLYRHMARTKAGAG